MRVRFAILLTLLPLSAAADEVRFLNGDRLTGRLESLFEGKIAFVSDVLGKQTIVASKVKSLSSDEKAVVVLTDGRTLETTFRIAEDGRILIGAEAIPFAKIKAINPPPPKVAAPPERISRRWTGSATTNFSLFSNTVSGSSLNMGLNVGNRTRTAVAQIDTAFLNSRQDSQTTEETWFLNGNYDFGVQRRQYGFLSARFRTDRIQKLDLRTLFGAGMGFRLTDNPRHRMRLNVGLTYLNESFTGATGKAKGTAELGYLIAGEPFKGFTLSHDLTYYPNLGNFGDSYLLTQLTLRKAIGGTLFLSAQAIVDYTSRPAAGAARATSKLIFSLGKSF